ncbi:DUF2550 domain-containing protein [Allosalinactinospora lopnorensis]|uniref:DUF2550 domain-containing protein n=1 Tax=Allosalinactinospora lopnorensis TaxID=1352348 RepID=UPI000623E9B4|nr:DUF2550 domain-containing protein [Allosalinactinospora lopnorensis]
MGEQLSSEIWFQIAEWLFFALLTVALLALVAVTVRRYVLERGGGAVECYLRHGTGTARPWRMGFGRYGTDELRWYRVFSLWPRPTAELSRRGLVIVGRRAPTGADLAELTSDLVVIEVGWLGTNGSDPKEPVYEIAMTESALTGFLSWLESMPPGGVWRP